MRKYILNIKWPKTITNEKVYEKTEIEKWSQIARKRRLKFFGNVYTNGLRHTSQESLEVCNRTFQKINRKAENNVTINNQIRFRKK